MNRSLKSNFKPMGEPMKKAYLRPRLSVHGNVERITQASQDSDREDRIFNAQGILTDTSVGSLDQCFFRPGTNECIIAGDG
jgi:hypothetical protein